MVGDTDAKGTLDYNTRLSQQRATAVVEALTTGHDIAPPRIVPHGVGPLVPVFSTPPMPDDSATAASNWLNVPEGWGGAKRPPFRAI